jgi:hypothetical protein
MYNLEDCNVTSWQLAASHILANNSVLAVAIRQLCLEAIDEGKVGIDIPSIRVSLSRTGVLQNWFFYASLRDATVVLKF